MNVQDKKKWLKALRSGEYKQTYGILRRTVGTEESFCCLGVLCEVMKFKRIKNYGYSYKKTDHYEKITKPMLKRVGLKEDTMEKLIEMNDASKMPFNKIASYISRNL